MQEEIEVWKTIPGYEGIYEASNLGRIKSLERIWFCKKNNSNSLIKERVLNPVINRSGYFKTTICKDKKRKQVLIHRLVLESC